MANNLNPNLNSSVTVDVLRPHESNSSSTNPNLPEAVLVRNAFKSYENGNPVLNKLNMTVERGTIYGLLGSSGCGKTTILSCIVGLKKLDYGKIRIFGHVPGSKECTKIGYMPQEIALYKIFTIKEMLQYFGRIYGMTQIEIKARMEFLVNFLDLPECSRLIGTLSGGQQRRTSLAVALIHQPELLLLDEPTVGVDPLLRESIWKHLYEMVERRQTTVIVTTHYIEESKDFNKVGLMRNGRLLIESSPLELLQNHGTNILEEVVLKICKNETCLIDPSNNPDEISTAISERSFYTRLKQRGIAKLAKDEMQTNSQVVGLSFESKRRPSIGDEEIAMQDLNQSQSKIQRNSSNQYEQFLENARAHANKVRSITIRNFLTLFRTPILFFAIVFIPASQVIFGNLIVGSVPKYNAVGLVNNDVNSTDIISFCKTNRTGCLPDHLSCSFLNQFPPEEINWISYSTEQIALKNVENGKTWGYISIPNNYTEYLRDRSLMKNFIDNETLDGSTITVRLDESLFLTTGIIKASFLFNFQQFLKELVSDCGGDERSVDVPFKSNPVYGSENPSFIDYIQAGPLCLIIFLLPMSSALFHLQDKTAGTLDRSIVAGVGHVHYVVAFVISEACMTIIQLFLCFLLLEYVFHFEIVGSIFLFYGIMFIMGMTGLSVGFLLESVCTHEMEYVLSLIGLHTNTMILSGGTWGLEGLPKWALTMCNGLPSTLAIQSLRGVAGRGWGLTHPKVYPGFLAMACWIVGSCVLSAIIRRNKKQ